MFKTMLLSIILYLVAVCGFSDGSATDEVGSPLQPKIIGGRNASENQFPFVMRHPLAYNRAIEPVTIPAFRQKLPVGTKATFVGWGLTQFQPYIISPPILQALDVTTISRQDCKYFWLYLDINTICVSSETSSAIPFKGACRGDSGGPLFVGNMQWGMNTRSSLNCSGLYPIKFIEVSRFSKWIRTTISRDYYKKRTTCRM
ncbi:brachyurin-like isoform X3 [Periplaneta americana]|uniref:brachyurin-like isoform X3 n=1 Tax=Periplaneta americana TaxID=6978 RepID=UPI0037E7AFFE